MKRVLVVEDEEAIREFEVINLQRSGYDVVDTDNGEIALELFDRYNGDFDLAVLDIMLPGIDGMKVCKELRKRSDTIGIILLTAKTQEMDKISGLMLGADDYITKPFNPVEVCARVRSQLRRYFQLGGGKARPETFVCGGIELNDESKQVTVDGEPVSLTPKEYDILRLLISEPGKVFSPKEIYRRVWKDIPLNSDNTVAVHIRHLREKIEIDPSEPRCLKVLFGQGYMIEEGMKR